MDELLSQRLYGSQPHAAAMLRAESETRSPYLGALIQRHFPADRAAVILDIGCGTGHLLEEAKRRGYRNIAGVDSAQARVDAARTRGLEKVVCQDLLEHLDGLPPQSHDLIIAFDVLEHFGGEDLVRLVDAVGKALRPGGRWLIHVPNGASPFFGQIFHGDLTHKTPFTAESLRWLLLASGFRELSCFEDTPLVHGVKSLVRRIGWGVLRTGLRLWTAIETGDTGCQAVLTRCLLAVATR